MMVCYIFGLVCVLTAYISTDAYVLKRAHRYDEENGDNRLADALKVIARERRRLKEAEGSLYNDYYWQDAPEPESRPMEGKAFLQGLFDEMGDEQLQDEDSVMLDNIDPRIYSNNANSVEYLPEEVSEEIPVEKSELENIFESDTAADDNKEEEKEVEKKAEDKRTNIPWQMGGTGGLPDKPDKKEEPAKRQNEPADTQLTSNEIAKLLSDAESVEEEELAKDEASPSLSAVPVSEAELNDVLGGQDVPAVNQKAEAPEQVEYQDIPSTAELNKEWLLNQYLQQPSTESSNKKKRSGDIVAAEEAEEFDEDVGPDELTEEEDEEIIETMEECLKQFIDLEDEENTKLAQALSLATLGQVERTDKYIPQEVEFLKGAVKDEEHIKNLRRCLKLGTAARGVAEQNKRSEPLFDYSDVEEQEPLISEELLEDIPEQTQEADFRDMLAEKLKLYLMRTSEPEMENEIEPEQFDDAPEEEAALNPFYRELYEQYAAQRGVAKRQMTEGSFGPLEDDQEEKIPETAEETIRDRLGHYISEMSMAERQELKQEVSEALNQIAVEEMGENICPAVEDYTDNCAYASQMGLELDSEAVDLCNRHQLCYTCGGSFGLGYKDCDQGFLDVADRLCEGDEDCNDEAAGLFVVMARGHTFVAPSETDSQCETECVLDYIVGPDGSSL